MATAKTEVGLRSLIKRCTSDPLYYLQNQTRTKDEQDKEHPYKPFPPYKYFEMLYAAWLAEPVLLIEKSRTMMLTWFFAGLCLHYAMTNPASRVIFWAQTKTGRCNRSTMRGRYGRTRWSGSRKHGHSTAPESGRRT
jgi:hypothetical protein